MPSFNPKMGIMKISASFPPWDGRPCLNERWNRIRLAIGVHQKVQPSRMPSKCTAVEGLWWKAQQYKIVYRLVKVKVKVLRFYIAIIWPGIWSAETIASLAVHRRILCEENPILSERVTPRLLISFTCCISAISWVVSCRLCCIGVG